MTAVVDTNVLAQQWDVILLNTSAGKDSVVMLDVVCRASQAAGCTAALRAVHCDLGRVEWAGTRDLAEEQVARYGIPFQVVSRSQDLLDHVESCRMAAAPDGYGWDGLGLDGMGWDGYAPSAPFGCRWLPPAAVGRRRLPRGQPLVQIENQLRAGYVPPQQQQIVWRQCA